MPTQRQRRRRRRRNNNDGGGGGNNNRNKTPKQRRHQDNLDRQQMADRYGYAMAFLEHDDELWKLFKEAVNKTWSVTKFQTELLDTKWFRKHSATYRQGMARKYSDPGEFKFQKRQMTQKIEGLASRYSAVISRDKMHDMAEDAILFGWSDDQMADHLAKFVRRQRGGHYGGSLASIEEQVKSTAYRNGVKVNKKTQDNWMRQIVRGQATMEEYTNSIRAHAQRTFKAFAQEIAGGMDLADVAAPYLDSAQQILELGPQNIDLFDPRVRKALTNKNEKGQVVPLGLTEFEESLRKDPRWRHTSNATESVSTAMYEVARMMGLRAR